MPGGSSPIGEVRPAHLLRITGVPCSEHHLVNLNRVKTNEAKSVTFVGTGNRWVDVYRKLDAEGLSVVGVRVADIGVGGLTLGGQYTASLTRSMC